MSDTSIFRMPDMPLTIRPLTTQQSTHLNASFPDLPKSPAQCITCKGRKTYRWYAPGTRDPQSIVTYECNCRDQFTAHRVMLNSGIPETYQRLAWADFEKLPDDAIALVNDYVGHAEGYVSAGYGVILHGTMGSGKTLLLYLLIKALMIEGIDVYGASFSTVLDTFGNSWTDREERAHFNRQIRNAGVLLVDDVGRERHQKAVLSKEERAATGATSGVTRQVSNHAESVLEEVIRHRVSRSMPTLITTNLTLDEIAQGYGGNTMSLLHERSTTVEFRSPDFRNRQRERITFEVRNGLTRPIVFG